MYSNKLEKYILIISSILCTYLNIYIYIRLLYCECILLAKVKSMYYSHTYPCENGLTLCYIYLNTYVLSTRMKMNAVFHLS